MMRFSMEMLRTYLLLTCTCLPSTIAMGEVIVDFEDLALYSQSTPAGDYFDGYGFTAGNAGWSSQGVTFNTNMFGPGWSYSNVNDSVTPGFGNQWASLSGTGFGGSGNYAIANGYDGAMPVFELPAANTLNSMYITNSTYAGLAVRDGNDGAGFVSGPFGSMFGSLDPNGEDYFRVSFHGFDALGAPTGVLRRYLADYRADKSDNVDAAFFGGADYVLSDWLRVDLTPLGSVKSVGLSFETTDVGVFGPNTPYYVAVDQLSYGPAASVPEPSSLALLAAGGGLAWWRRRRGIPAKSQ